MQTTRGSQRHAVSVVQSRFGLRRKNGRSRLFLFSPAGLGGRLLSFLFFQRLVGVPNSLCYCEVCEHCKQDNRPVDRV